MPWWRRLRDVKFCSISSKCNNNYHKLPKAQAQIYWKTFTRWCTIDAAQSVNREKIGFFRFNGFNGNAVWLGIACMCVCVNANSQLIWEPTKFRHKFGELVATAPICSGNLTYHHFRYRIVSFFCFNSHPSHRLWRFSFKWTTFAFSFFPSLSRLFCLSIFYRLVSYTFECVSLHRCNLPLVIDNCYLLFPNIRQSSLRSHFGILCFCRFSTWNGTRIPNEWRFVRRLQTPETYKLGFKTCALRVSRICYFHL